MFIKKNTVRSLRPQLQQTMHLYRVEKGSEPMLNGVYASTGMGDKLGGKMTFLPDRDNPSVWVDVWFESLPLLEEP